MGRSTAKPAQIPGAPSTDADAADTAAHQTGGEGADSDSASDSASDTGTAGAGDGETVFTTTKSRRATHDEKDARIAELEAQLAEAKRLPQVVYEPKTPHGQAALAASDTANMTVAQVMAAIDAGQLREPLNSYLCADGYYARRA